MTRKGQAAVGAWALLTLLTVFLAALGFVEAWADPRVLGSVVPDLAEELRLGARFPMVAGLIVPAVIKVVLAAFVVWRRPHDGMAVLFAVVLVAVFAGLSARATGATFLLRPWTQPAVLIVWFTAYASMGWFLVAFPDGRVPRRWAIAVPTSLVAAFAVYPTFGAAYIFLPELPGEVVRFGLSVGLLAVGFTVAVAAQSNRYRFSAGPVQRQQLKLGIFPFLLLMCLAVVQFASNFVGSYPRFNAVTMLLMIPVLLFMPVAWTLAILRYRLYDIDRIISRTVSYALLTGLLLAVYLGVVFALQQLLSPLTGESELAVAGATLFVAALFGPLRRRVQVAVDRRFNRARYDAQRTVEQFRGRLRDEVDLDQLGTELVGAVRSTVEPAELSLWLNPREAEAKS